MGEKYTEDGDGDREYRSESDRILDAYVDPADDDRSPLERRRGSFARRADATGHIYPEGPSDVESAIYQVRVELYERDNTGILMDLHHFLPGATVVKVEQLTAAESTHDDPIADPIRIHIA